MNLCVLLSWFQLSELKLGELLDTPPPGLDEAMAISKVCATPNQLSYIFGSVVKHLIYSYVHYLLVFSISVSIGLLLEVVPYLEILRIKFWRMIIIYSTCFS